MMEWKKSNTQESDWDSENFEVPVAIPATANKWEGEDEEDMVKESWDDDEEEKKREEQAAAAARKATSGSAQSKKPKSKLMEKIEERERKEREMKKAYSKGKDDFDDDEEETGGKNVTPDQIHAEKLRKQRLQEEADFEVAKQMLGISDDDSVDKLNPKTSEDFTLFQEALLKKILLYKKSEHFSTFAENFIRELCVNLTSADLKKLKITIDNIYNEKVKAEKAKTQKPKAKSKAKLRVEGGLYDEYSAYTVDDYDEFI